MNFDPTKLIKLPRSFYTDDVLSVTPSLLGKLLVRRKGSRFLAGMIVELEAYDGSIDEAAHTFNGKTQRNEVMFGEGGFLYVYFTYGMHYCCNVVTGNKDSGQACLIRALEPVDGIDLMNLNRFGTADENNVRNLTNGPAKICQAFNINKNENGMDLTGDSIFISEYNNIAAKNIRTSKRIGIKKSAEFPWRYFIDGNPFVSKTPRE